MHVNKEGNVNNAVIDAETQENIEMTTANAAINNTTVDMAMQTSPECDPRSVADFSPKQIKQLSEVLFPLFLDAMEKHIEDTINSPLKSLNNWNISKPTSLKMTIY